MKTIQIVTPQNVLIEHELANVVMRGLAFAIDQILILVSIIFLFILLNALGFDEDLVELFAYVVILPLYFLYSLLMETYNYGQTVGKLMVGIKVRLVDGNEITFTAAATRWLMRIPDIFVSAGSLAALMISSSERSQRFGDILAGTIVIRQTPASSISLASLLKISTVENYEPQFPEVLQLKEQDVVTIKETLVRAKKYNNEGHRQAVVKLVERLTTILNIDRNDQEPTEFLRTLIKDYIVLTR